MAQKCEGCKKDISLKDMMACSACPLKFHHVCLNITGENFKKQSKDYKLAWKCPTCRSSDRKGDNTPVRAISSVSIPLSPPAPSETAMLAAIKDQVDSAVKDAVTRTIKPEFDELRADMSVLKDMKSSIEFMCKEFERLNSELTAAKSNIADLQADNTSLKGTVNDLSSRITLLEHQSQGCDPEISGLPEKLSEISAEIAAKEQRERINNIEIKGVPLKKSENLFELVTKISDVIGHPVLPSQINFVTRSRSTADVKPIVVGFLSRYTKENFVASARACKNLTAENLGFSGVSTRVFVNDHLTRDNKQLLTKTKKVALERNYRYTWVQNCKILVRKNDTSPITHILSEKDLVKIK